MTTINEQLAQEFYNNLGTDRSKGFIKKGFYIAIEKGFTDTYRTFCHLVTKINQREQMRVARLTPLEKNPATQLPCGCSCNCDQKS